MMNTYEYRNKPSRVHHVVWPTSLGLPGIVFPTQTIGVHTCLQVCACLTSGEASLVCCGSSSIFSNGVFASAHNKQTSQSYTCMCDVCKCIYYVCVCMCIMCMCTPWLSRFAVISCDVTWCVIARHVRSVFGIGTQVCQTSKSLSFCCSMILSASSRPIFSCSCNSSRWFRCSHALIPRLIAFCSFCGIHLWWNCAHFDVICPKLFAFWMKTLCMCFIMSVCGQIHACMYAYEQAWHLGYNACMHRQTK